MQRPPSRAGNEPQRPPSRAGNEPQRPPSRAGNEPQRPPSRAGAGQQRPPSRPGTGQQGTPPDIATTLLCVAFSGPIKHWGIIHVDRDGGNSGTLIHIGVRKVSGKSSKTDHRVRTSRIESMSTSSIRNTYPIQGAVITCAQAEAILDEVHTRNGDYHAILNNCQHFCISGVKELQSTVCPTITDQTIANLTKKTSTVTQCSIWVREGRLGQSAGGSSSR